MLRWPEVPSSCAAMRLLPPATPTSRKPNTCNGHADRDDEQDAVGHPVDTGPGILRVAGCTSESVDDDEWHPEDREGPHDQAEIELLLEPVLLGRRGHGAVDPGCNPLRPPGGVEAGKGAPRTGDHMFIESAEPVEQPAGRPLIGLCGVAHRRWYRLRKAAVVSRVRSSR